MGAIALSESELIEAAGLGLPPSREQADEQARAMRAFVQKEFAGRRRRTPGDQELKDPTRAQTPAGE